MIYTINQINDGKSEAITARDLNNYVKKVDSVDKTDYESLKLTVANKLDKSPEHSHTISAITQLQQQLDDKLSKSTLYSYNSIISDIDQISHINNLNVDSLTIGEAKTNITDIYENFDNNLHDIQSNVTELQNKFAELQSSLTDLTTAVDNINSVLANHKEVILELCEKCGIEIDASNEKNNESNNITDTDVGEPPIDENE
jgi:methyl-accepting chemotaxis protein